LNNVFDLVNIVTNKYPGGVLCNEDWQQQEWWSVSTARIGEYFNRKKGVGKITAKQVMMAF